MNQARSVLPDLRTVAVVGASTLEGSNYYGSRLMANLVDAGSGVTIYPINPRLAGQEVMGWPAYAGLQDVPETPDLVVIVTPTAVVARVLAEAGELGVKNCLVISNELGGQDAKAAFRTEIRSIATRYEMRVIGPNSMGVLFGTTMINASFASGAHQGGLKPGGLAMLGQSGSAISYLLETNRESQLGYSWLISTGDEASASLESLFEAVLEDSSTQAVLLFIEGIADGDRFRRSAQRASDLGKPVVMLQVGVSDVGRAAVHSHTGRLAGLESAYDAVGRESGMLRARTFDDLFSLGRVMVEQTVARSSRAHGRRVCVLTSSGGTGSYAADHFRRLGWTLPQLRPDIRTALETSVGQFDLENPVDLTGSWSKPDLLPTALGILAADPEIDTFVVATGAGGTVAAPVAEALVAGRPETDAELYVAWTGASSEVRQIFDGSGFTALNDVASVASAAEASAAYRNRPDRTGSAGLVGARRSLPNGRARRHEPRESSLWTAGTTIESLVSHGVTCARTVVLPPRPRPALTKAAAEIGYPITVKVDSPSLVHKIDRGGVVVGVNGPDRLEEHLDEFDSLIEQAELSDARIILQEMKHGAEIFAGITYDECFGHLLMVGVGGTYIELLGETETIVLPNTREHIEAVVRGRPVLNSILHGYRGREPADVAALLDVICGFAEWGTDPRRPLLLEADLNPIFLSENGAHVVDARSSWSTA